MNEEELTSIIDSIIEPVRDQQIEFGEKVIKAIGDAFIKGIEVGRKLKD
jgi:hypothetical protein